MALLSTFDHFSSLAGELTEDDMVAEDVLQKHLASQDDPEKVLEFIKSKHGGGGMAKCYPLSYLQGNFAYHHLKGGPSQD